MRIKHAPVRVETDDAVRPAFACSFHEERGARLSSIEARKRVVPLLANALLNESKLAAISFREFLPHGEPFVAHRLAHEPQHTADGRRDDEEQQRQHGPGANVLAHAAAEKAEAACVHFVMR